MPPRCPFAVRTCTLVRLLAARLTFLDSSERFSLAVYGDNLTDEEYFTFGQNALQAQGVAYNYIGRPREFGVTLGVRF